MQIFDLHCHSNKSDGKLTVPELIERANKKGVGVLALTDHDTTAGLTEAKAESGKLGIKFINGVEISTKINGKSIHIVGLNFDQHNDELQNLLNHHQQLRWERAKLMAQKVEKLGVKDALTQVQEITQGNISRSHFAQVLIANGIVSNNEQAFKKYLTYGKPAYVTVDWCDIPTAIKAIHSAGGKAVFAHPLRYDLTNGRLRTLLKAFKVWGGDGMEVANCGQSISERNYLTTLALENNLCASVGSDFHYPCPWRELGHNLVWSEKLKFILD